jgi:hypothetical protein
MPYLIKKYLYRVNVILMSVLFACCTSKNSTNIIVRAPAVFTVSSSVSVELDTKFIANEVNIYGKSIPFYCGIEKLYGNEYFTYLDNADSLTFIQLQNKVVRKVYIGNITSKMGEYYLSRITENKLLLLSREKKYFYEYSIDENFILALQKEYNLNTTGKLNKVRFLTYPDATRFISSNSSLFINYAKGNEKNFIDKHAIVYFDLTDPALEPKFIINYPENYHKERIENKELLFDMLNDSCLAFGYMQHDEVGTYNIRNSTTTTSQISHNCKFLLFDEQKTENLGYVAKYLLTNEGNYKLFSDSLQRIYLFKKLGKAQKKDTTVMECYVFDNQLKPVTSFKIDQTVCQAYIYKYRQGFLAFNDSLNKAYYYEFK